MHNKLPIITLLLLISFASVNAVLFTPALPQIALFFNVSAAKAQYTVSWFLIAYALGQLIYGPLANRFGRKPAAYVGIIIQILSSLLCVAAGYVHRFEWLVSGRFLLALGSGVGLKMTFTMVNESYPPKEASKKISYLMLAFAITPGIAVALGGILNTYYGWMACFWAGALYGILLFFLVRCLPETQPILDPDAFKLRHLISEYQKQFQNKTLLAGGLLMGGAAGFVYLFAALAPFIAIDTYKMNSFTYGLANILPPIGLIAGSLASAWCAGKFSLQGLIKFGMGIASIGVLLMIIAALCQTSVWLFLFFPMIVLYFGNSFIMVNSSTLAMMHVKDKAHGSAVMNFLNMGFATLMVLMLPLFPHVSLLLPSLYFFIILVMLGLLIFLKDRRAD